MSKFGLLRVYLRREAPAVRVLHVSEAQGVRKHLASHARGQVPALIDEILESTGALAYLAFVHAEATLLRSHI